MSTTHWVIGEGVPAEARKEFPELHPVALQLLWNRGVRTLADVEKFLGSDWSRDTHSPWLFTQMRAAVDRVFAALEKGETITVHGDYDADGVCGTTVLVSTLRDLVKAFPGEKTSKIDWYIPHREKEGYGMSVETAGKLTDAGSTLLITVDCGISNAPAIDHARTRGADTIVCDHHAMPPELPQGAVLLHPQVPGETYPNKHLCGTGVAFKLASGLIDEARARGARFPEGYEKWLLDLVAIATVTDVMPLTGENRVLERYGLLVLNKTRRVGLQKLIEASGGTLGTLDTVSIGFQIGPRLNAAGRMEHASHALELMLEEESSRAAELAMNLNRINADRQAASERMYKEALAMVGDPGTQRCLIVAKEDWGPGLVGLVAGKLVNLFHRPVYAVGKEGEKWIGSGRTHGKFDVTKALHAAAETLDRFGGHPQACGFSTTGDERFAAFKEAMFSYAVTGVTDEDLLPTQRIDADIPLADAHWELIDALAKFEPFGEANPRPVFCSRNIEVLGAQTMGTEGKHLRLTARQNGVTKKLVGFSFGHLAPKLTPGITVDVAYELGVNEWNGNREVQLRIVDVSIV